MSDLLVQATISGALPDLVIDGSNAQAYELHPDTAAEQETSWRKQEASNTFVEGSFTTSAVRENVIEALSIWVNGDTQDEVDQRKFELLRRFGQRKYTVTLVLAGVTQVWSCFPAAYGVQTRHEYLHAPTTLVNAKVPRLPKRTITGAFGTLVG